MQTLLSICLPCLPQQMLPLCICPQTHTRKTFLHPPPHINQVPQLPVVWTLIPPPIHYILNLRRHSCLLCPRIGVLSSCPRQAETTHPNPHPKRSIPCLYLPIAPSLLLWKLHSSQMQTLLSICLPCLPQQMLPLCICPQTHTRKTFLHPPPHINQVPQLPVVWTLIPNVLPQLPMWCEIFSLPSPTVGPNTFLPGASPTPYTAVNTTLPRTRRRGGNSKFSSFMRESRSSLKLELRSWFPYQSSGACWVKVCSRFSSILRLIAAWSSVTSISSYLTTSSTPFDIPSNHQNNGSHASVSIGR